MHRRTGTLINQSIEDKMFSNRRKVRAILNFVAVWEHFVCMSRGKENVKSKHLFFLHVYTGKTTC